MRLPLLLLALALSACVDEEAVAPGPRIAAGLITPGQWVVSGSPDHILVWAHNQAGTPVTISWKMRFANGTDVPAEWELRAAASTATLQPDGTKATRNGEIQYTSWAWTLFTIEVPAKAGAGTHKMVIDTGSSRHPFDLKVAANQTRVSQPADHVELTYDGKFERTGQSFDDGQFDTRLGSGDTVPGFDQGLIGLALNENTALILPPPLGYGYDQTHRNYVQFNGQTLRFDVRIVRFLTSD